MPLSAATSLDLQQLFEQAPGFMVVLRGPEHVFSIVNRAYYQLVGHRPLVGRAIREALPDVVGQGYFQLLDQVYRTGESARGEGARVMVQRTREAPPEVAYVDFVYQPLKDAAGNVTGIFVQGNEVTARILAEEALRRANEEIESQARTFNTALSAIKDFAYIFDREGRFIYVNKPLLDLWGMTLAQAVGKTFFELPYPAELAAQLQSQIEQVFATRAALVDETPYTSPAGQTAWYEYIFTPVTAADGTIQAVAGSTRDISERKRAEVTLRDADRRKDEFLATLAHELRNPLAPIRHASAILSKGNATEAQLRWSHGIIERQVQQMAHLLDDLLDVSRITRGRLELRRSRFDIADVVSSAVEAARPMIEARQHQLTVKQPPDCHRIEADPVRVEQMLGNLLVNAAKYTEPGGRITLEVSCDDAEVVIRVRDTGIGIDPQVLPHVFEMFSQATTALERAEGGLGIGLALVKGLAELHGGRVEARSAGLGFGSEFALHLPRGVPAQAAGADRTGSSTDSRAAPRRILIVDDNRDSAETLALALQLDGHTALAVYDGSSALTRGGELAPEVVLLDIGMPELNGYEVAALMREQPWGSSAVLVAITGWAQEADRLRARDAGFDHHLAKPVELAALTALLASLGTRA